MAKQADILTLFPYDTTKAIQVYEAKEDTKLTFFLESAGPVSIGVRADLTPVGSGKGRLLPQKQPVDVFISTGQIIYMAVTGQERVAFMSQPIPYMELIVGLLRQTITSMSGAIKGAVGTAFQSVANPFNVKR